MLELAVLGLLHESPMHGYELRKRLHDSLGVFRTLSCGTLYPALRRLLRAGLIEETGDVSDPPGWGRRTKRIYRITDAGERRFTELVGDCGPRACDDIAFGVHMVFFSRTPVEARLRLLQARKRRVQERRDCLRSALAGSGTEFDRYARQLCLLRLDHSEHEVRWLNGIIEHERAEQAAAAASDRCGAGGLEQGLDR